MNVFSFGGGVQSIAALILAAQGEIDCHTFLFANVGDDSENADTLRYVREIAMPYAARHGLEIITLHKRTRTGEVAPTLYQTLTSPTSRSIPIPVRMANGAPGNRSCTYEYKIRPVANWCWKQGARPKCPATVMLGISREEAWRRMNVSRISYVVNAYPLVDLGLSRQDCMNVITRAGQPIPPKSACDFCTYKRLAQWREQRDKKPDVFARNVALERQINERRARLGKDPVWLSSAGKPLDKAVGDASQPSLFDEDEACESGYCMV